MAVDLGNNTVSSPRSQFAQFLAEGVMAGARPSMQIIAPEIAAEKRSNFLQNIGKSLAIGGMAYAEGMGAGNPYSTFMKTQEAQQANQLAAAKAQEDLRRWKIEEARKQGEDASQAETRKLNAQIMKKQLEMMGNGDIPSATINGIETPLYKKGATEFPAEDYIIKEKIVNIRGIPTIQKVPELKPMLPTKESELWTDLQKSELALKQNLGLLEKDKKLEGYMSPLNIKAYRGGNFLGDIGNTIVKMDPKDANWGVFKAETDKTFQVWKKYVTGAQAALGELGWLAPDFPETTDNPTLYKAKAIEAVKRMDELKQLMRNKWSPNYRMSGLDASVDKDMKKSDGKLGVDNLFEGL